MKCPELSRTVIISDMAHLAAQLSCALAKPGVYLPVIDGPRLTRPDGEAETIRRNNAAARAKADRIIFAGLSKESDAAFHGHLPAGRIVRVAGFDDIKLVEPSALERPKLVWGRDRLGIGLLKAMREGAMLSFNDEPSPRECVPSKSGHLVICEEGEELSEVIAANYAYSMRAGLHLIPQVSGPRSQEILEALYSLYDGPSMDGSPSQRLERLQSELRDLCGPIEIPVGGSTSWIVRDLPFGFAFPGTPSTHLFNYPDLGISVINGFAAEQPGSRGVNVAVLVDPETVEAPEMADAAKLLSNRRTFVRGYRGPGATVRSVSDLVELFPYDLLMFATHCGDASGYRWTYQFTDSEGIDRTLVVDIALGIGSTDDKDMLEVVQFIRFHSLDGVDWNDPEKSDKVYVGKAINDWSERSRGPNELEPVKKETVPRVAGSAAMRMYDNNYIALPHSLAGYGTPIVVNNACVSWHELASRFAFEGARAYVGTLFPVGTTEAHDVIVGLFDKHYGKPLAHALWSSQNAVYRAGVRRPYVMTGIYPQRLRVTTEDVPRRIFRALTAPISGLTAQLARLEAQGKEFGAKRTKEQIEYYKREAVDFKKRWGL